MSHGIYQYACHFIVVIKHFQPSQGLLFVEDAAFVNLCFVKKQKENKGGKDVEGKIFADMLSGVWNDARPLEHNVGDTCKVVQCVILRALPLNVQLRPIAMSAMLQYVE